MDRLSLVVASEIKYTEQYCYNKESKTTKKTTTLQEETIAWKKYMYIKQFCNQH